VAYGLRLLFSAYTTRLTGIQRSYDEKSPPEGPFSLPLRAPFGRMTKNLKFVPKNPALLSFVDIGGGGLRDHYLKLI
jgi:hypothetical protein